MFSQSFFFFFFALFCFFVFCFFVRSSAPLRNKNRCRQGNTAVIFNYLKVISSAPDPAQSLTTYPGVNLFICTYSNCESFFLEAGSPTGDNTYQHKYSENSDWEQCRLHSGRGVKQFCHTWWNKSSDWFSFWIYQSFESPFQSRWGAWAFTAVHVIVF